MDVLIREARAGELAAVGRLSAGVYGSEGLAPPAYLPVLRDAAARAAAPLTEVVVAVEEAGGLILGALTLCQHGSPFADLAVEGEAEVRILAVRASARRRGIGEALLRHCAQRARSLGCRRLVLSTQPAMVTAQRLYERAGFRRVHERDLRLRETVTLLAYALNL
jgi:ribosomal protein S18 acetylase RimI-like enzyme